MIFLILFWNVSTVSSAGTGEVVKVPDFTSSFTQGEYVYNFSANASNAYSTSGAIKYYSLLFTIPDTKAEDEYTVRLRFKNFKTNVAGQGTSISQSIAISCTAYFSYSLITSTNSSNSSDIFFSQNIYSFASSTGCNEIVFDVIGLEGVTPIYVFFDNGFSIQNLGTVTYTVPAMSAYESKNIVVAQTNVDVFDISYERQVGSDDLLSESKKQTEIQEDIKQTSKNIFERISQFFDGFFDGIIKALLSLFVPDDDFFTDYFSRLNNFFTEKLGFLYFPVDLLIKIIEGISNASTSPPGIDFPGVEWEGQYIIEPQVFSFSSLFDELPDLQDAIYLGTDIIMIGALLLLLQNKLKEVLTK